MFRILTYNVHRCVGGDRRLDVRVQRPELRVGEEAGRIAVDGGVAALAEAVPAGDPGQVVGGGEHLED